ncbi:MAG: sulfatase family protein, partial [Candidatus Binatia bacterium]
HKNRAIHPGMDPRDLEHVIALYDGEIAFTDEHVGRIVDLLGELDLSEDTIVAVTADHGDEFFEHGRKGHRKNLYDETLRVPLVFRYPRKLPAGLRVDRAVRLTDVAPTLLGLAGIAPPPSWGSTVRSGSGSPRDLTSWTVASETESLPALFAFGELEDRLASLRTDRFKLVIHLKGGTAELYDLLSDPGERRNLAERDRETRSSLELELLGWRRQFDVGDSFTEPVELSPEQVERLRALGYVE